ATVSGESSAKCPLGCRVPGRRRKVKTREPGDLPSAVVMRECCRSGCTGGGRTNHPLDVWGTKFAVTCHRACYPRCLHVVAYCRHAAQLSLRRPYRCVFGHVVFGVPAQRASVGATCATKRTRPVW